MSNRRKSPDPKHHDDRAQVATDIRVTTALRADFDERAAVVQPSEAPLRALMTLST
ncbi:hypothetical protein [Streptomyces sp. NPDC057418]|uniref:hypothetical protein n=1 Tax=Streptomyces sp. NPDC057418 TaxID=3346126 RepID=UPI00367A4EB9